MLRDRDQERAARTKRRARAAEQGEIVLEVLDDVEEADDVEAAGERERPRVGLEQLHAGREAALRVAQRLDRELGARERPGGEAACEVLEHEARAVADL